MRIVGDFVDFIDVVRCLLDWQEESAQALCLFVDQSIRLYDVYYITILVKMGEWEHIIAAIHN